MCLLNENQIASKKGDEDLNFDCEEMAAVPMPVARTAQGDEIP